MDPLQFLTVFAMFLLIGWVIAYFIGRKKRIGFGWTLFFSIFLTPMIALLLVILSPPLKKLPPNNPKDKLPYAFVQIFFLLAIIAGLMEAARTESGITLVDIYRGIGPLGIIIYLFGRGERNKKLYKESNPMLTREEIEDRIQRKFQ